MIRLKKLYQKDVYISRLLLIGIAWLVFMALTKYSKFYSLLSFQTMATQFPEFGLMAIGVMLCMITGGIDLSVVGIANLSAITMGLFSKALVTAEGTLDLGSILLLLVLSLALGAVAGVFNGVLVSKIGIPAILATLGANELYYGIGVVLTQGKAVSKLPMEYSSLMTAKIFGLIPMQFLIFAIAVLIVGFLMSRTNYGIKLYMLGTNQKASRFSGINNDAMLIKTYMISGMCAALGGMIMLANYNSARSDYGAAYTLQTILIVVLGGVSPQGGRGKLSGVVLSILVLQLLSSGLNRFQEINAFLIPLIWGVLLVSVMILNYFTDNSMRGRRISNENSKG